MYIPEWVLILLLVIVVCVIASLVKRCKYHHSMAVSNYRQWGLMRYEFERISHRMIVLHQRLYEHPELIRAIENELGKYAITDLDMWHEAYEEPDYTMTFRKVREIIYKHNREYDYADVEQDMNYFEKYRSE